MLEITSRDTLDPTIVQGEFGEFISALNLAHAQGKQFIVATEVIDDGTESVALETRNITRIRVRGDDAFLSS